MAQKPPEGPGAPRVTDEFLSAKVEIDLDSYYQRLLNETRRLLADLQQQGYTGRDLADRVAAGLSSLSDKPIEDMGRASTAEAFNLGRNLEAQEQSTVIGEVVRTEVLDENTCEPCSTLDGTVVQINTPEYFHNMPPNHCDGRERCRGFYLYRVA